ncbi:hypothetical protein LO762_25480 [Actinocorallia sp. API 0066]|uniref:hypothetical protein n=1 Tax=Actinocorallia sp. API 0066 TaxID=2896846 RepID=UPI001E40829F|nr:hypothetical protein [Actinocorallia sp. API 0066]MCD0452511.1 hypothetical protein [Actinocorallia sp. API 0066]
MQPDRQPDRPRSRMRDRLEAMRARAEKSTSWRVTVAYLLRLVNREGEVPVRARLSREDLLFLGEAREEVATLAEMALRVLELHQPRGSGGLTSDPDHPLHRCRTCMTRWPCATFRILAETLDR